MRCSFEKCMWRRNNLYEDTISTKECSWRSRINGKKTQDVDHGVKDNVAEQLFKGDLCTFSIGSLDWKLICNWQDSKVSAVLDHIYRKKLPRHGISLLWQYAAISLSLLIVLFFPVLQDLVHQSECKIDEYLTKWVAWESWWVWQMWLSVKLHTHTLAVFSIFPVYMRHGLPETRKRAKKRDLRLTS